MSTAAPANTVPRSALLLAGAAVALAIVGAAVGRLTGAADSTPTAAPVATRDLFFHDMPNGAVTVFDARHMATPLATVAPESNGFLRGTVRGLAHQRLRENVGPQLPFRLTAWADGRLTLFDPATDRRVELEAFGHTNAGAFAQLLAAPEPAP